MALNKQAVPINFAQGLDLKTDPFQVPVGKFLALRNTVFDKGGQLKKRNGYGMLPSLPDATSTLVTTFNGNLTALGSKIRAFSSGANAWIDRGTLQPAKLDTLPLVRSSTNQTQADAVTHPNGLTCVVYTDNIPTTQGVTVPSYRYAILESATGQSVVSPTAIPVASGAITQPPKVFLLNNYFIIVFSNLITATDHLQYCAVSAYNPTSITANTDISTTYSPGTANTAPKFEGVVNNNNLYLAWNATDGGGAIRMGYIDSTLTLHGNQVASAGLVGDIISVVCDDSGGTPTIYVTAYTSGTTTARTFAVDQGLNSVLAAVTSITTEDTANITGTATSGVLTLYYERNNNYTYDSAIPTHYIKKVTVTHAGVVGTPSVVVRSLGLASKAFFLGTAVYFLATYQSTYQPTYFMVNSSGQVIAKLAYANGGGYKALGLPNITVDDTEVSLPYLVKDQISSVNKSQNAVTAGGVYSQTGINLATISLDSSRLSVAEIGGNLSVSGGILWAYDGYSAVESNFHLWPDSVETTASTGGGSMTPQQYFYVATYEWADNQGGIYRSAPSLPVSVTPTASVVHTFTAADVNTGANTIAIAAHGYSTGTSFTLTTGGTLPTPLLVATTYYVIRVDANTIKVASSLANALLGTPIDITVAGSGTSTITPASNQNSVTVNIPTLRVTYKTANPVKVVLYRWSAAQQTYYQVTSLAAPLLNDTTIDSVTYLDTSADSAILGNSILYTTGGVIENIGPPSVKNITLFQSRLFYINAEDQNSLGFSKVVIERTPVETSDLFTIYVAPTTSAQGSTGVMRCLAALDDKLIVFKDSAIYYINGQGPDNTGAQGQFSDPVFVTSTVGCDNQQSIVFIPQGLMFQSQKGIWLLNRDLSTTYIGAPVEDLTRGAVVQSAVNIPETNQVRFTLDTGITLMYDYYYGQWGTFINVPAVSSTLYQGVHAYINSFGQVYQETPGTYLDGSKPVLMSFTTSWLNLAGLQGYERAYYFYLLGVYLSPHKLAIQIAYDYNSSPTQTSMILPDNFTPNWGGISVWGGGESWGGNSNVEQWRVFLQQQKCQAFQVTLNEIYDPSYGYPAGAGLTLSGLDMIVGTKSGYPRIKSSRSAG